MMDDLLVNIFLNYLIKKIKINEKIDNIWGNKGIHVLKVSKIRGIKIR